MKPTARGALVSGLIASLATGCGEAPAPAPANQAVAWVGPDTLYVEQLGRLLVLAQPFPLETGAAVDLARHWQLATVLARDPSIGRAAATAAPAHDAALAAFVAARLPEDAADDARSVYRAGDLRLIAHVLRRADRSARVEERTIQRRAADAVLADLRSSGDWSAANRRNEDDAARAAGGVIGLFARGELPPPLDSIAFALPPGGFSEVIATDAGFHVLHRPAWEQAGDEFALRLHSRRADEHERQLAAEAAIRRKAGLAPVALLRIRELATDPWSGLTATDPVGSFDGGSLTGGDLAAALAALAWDSRRALLEAAAPEREAFAGRALVRAALRADALDAGVAGDDVAYREDLMAQLDSIARHLAASGEPAVAVDRYMGRLAARHVPLVMPSPRLWASMFSTVQAGFRVDAIGAAIDRARVLLEAGGQTAVNP